MTHKNDVWVHFYIYEWCSICFIFGNYIANVHLFIEWKKSIAGLKLTAGATRVVGVQTGNPRK
jgi:hypothetical protein